MNHLQVVIRKQCKTRKEIQQNENASECQKRNQLVHIVSMIKIKALKVVHLVLEPLLYQHSANVLMALC